MTRTQEIMGVKRSMVTLQSAAWEKNIFFKKIVEDIPTPLYLGNYCCDCANGVKFRFYHRRTFPPCSHLLYRHTPQDISAALVNYSDMGEGLPQIETPLAGSKSEQNISWAYRRIIDLITWDKNDVWDTTNCKLNRAKRNVTFTTVVIRWEQKNNPEQWEVKRSATLRRRCSSCYLLELDVRIHAT